MELELPKLYTYVRCKQYGQRSDCSYSSSLIWVYIVEAVFNTFQHMTKEDKICCVVIGILMVNQQILMWLI